ncbi:S8 family peptidase [Alkaliphilus transvaalensis]|uniref:Serine protease n=1 Tax=Alkaliphilus transvaalensis TaxID=114628 RepID=Q08IT0_9FIRM|nr:S8 family peptidase [Alkaliphilus transvaalensis]BAF34115.1 serine protease [Alkaliphilus transvaalensis]
MKKMLAVLMILVLSIGILVPVSASVSAENEKQEYLVGFNGKASRGLVQAFGVQNEAILHEFQYIDTVLMELTPAQAKALANNPNVEYVEENAEVHLLAQSTPWGVTRVQAPNVWNRGFTGSGVRVAVLDTGIHSSHEDLTVSGGYSVFGDSPYNDVQGHGTHVAGTIAARNNSVGVIGVAYNAQLYAVKVLNNQGSGTLAGIAQGIEWARQNNMHVINMSLGGTSGSTTLQNAVNAAYNAGILVVAAAGNSGNSAGTGDNVGFPARYPNAMAVAATTSGNVRASFSSTGPAVEIAAPGQDINSTYPTNTYRSLNGTSMAAPHVAGVAALLKSARPAVTAAGIRNAMNSTALNLGNSNWYGNGLVRANNALDMVLSY